MERIFLSVINMSLTSSFIITAIMLARLPLKKAPKIISYALWAVAGFRLVFPFTLESVFSLLPFKAAPIPHDIAMQAVPRIDSGITIIDNAVSASLPAAAPCASVNPLQIWIFIGSCVWLFGVAAMLIYSFVSIVLLKRRLRGAALIEGNLYETDNLKTPFVIGLFKPKIYIPAGLTDEERLYIIMHEQTHIRRYDHIVKMLAYFILCIHWFNPLAWAAFILMGADMEMSCDERVMHQLGGEIKKAYSLSLVRVASGRKILNGSPLAFGEGGMKERVKNVLNFGKPPRVIIVAAVALMTVLSVGFAVNRTTSGNLADETVRPQNIGTTYSPDSKYFIEGYGVDYDYKVSGLNPIKQFRIVEADSGKTVWSMDGFFLYGSTPPFAWSSDSKYVYAAYAGRTWKEVLVVDTTDMSEHPLPGLFELAPLFPKTTPDDNRPDPYIEALSWYEHKLAVAFSWRVKEDVDNEDNRIYGEYMYDADIHEFTLRYDLDEHYSETDETALPNGSISEISRKVEDGLSIIMSSPLTSSNPQDYINEHWQEYENLTAKYPEGVLEYLLSQFEADNADGLRGHIMMLMCKDMLGLKNNVTDDSLSPQEWYEQLSVISEIKLPDFTPEKPEDGYGGLIYSTITQYYSQPDDGFVVLAPTVYGTYEEDNKLKIFVTVFYERYKLYDKTLESTGGGVIPGAILFNREEHDGGWVLEEYLEVGTANLPDGAYFEDSIRKLCMMPVSGTEIKGLAEKISSDYNNASRNELLTQNLIKHLMAQVQIGVSLKKPSGEMIPLT